MGNIREWLMDLIGLRKDIDGNDLGNILDEQIEKIYTKELAIASCVNLIANAIAECEIKTYENGTEVKGEKYYELNYAPNPNENSAQLWHKAIEKMIYEKECIIVSVSGQLHVADSYAVDGYAIRGNVYKDVVISCDNGEKLQLNRLFKADEVIKLKLSDMNIKRTIDGLASDYDEMLTLARENYKHLNQVKYKLILDTVKTERENFQEIFNKKVKSQLKNYINDNNAVYVQYKGYDLQRQESAGKADSSDFIELRKELFYIVAQSFNIPAALILGDTTRNQNVNDLVNLFLTFCIDPIADMIQEELTRKIYPGYDNFNKGNYIVVDTSTVKHIDVLGSADSVDKLLSSGVLNRNELRKILSLEPIDDESAETYFITKNYSAVDDMSESLAGPVYPGDSEGGENDE